MKNRLLELRKEYGENHSGPAIEQKELAKRINFSQQTVSRYEKGDAKLVNPLFEDAVCEFFNCSLSYLRCKTNIRNEAKYSENLQKIKVIVEELIAGNQKEKQDISEDDLAIFMDWLNTIKLLFNKTQENSLPIDSINTIKQHFDKE